MTALVFQNAACAWRCWYCFVPGRASEGRSKPIGVVHSRRACRPLPPDPRCAAHHRPLGRFARPRARMDPVDDAGARRRGACGDDLSLDRRQPKHYLLVRKARARRSRHPAQLIATTAESVASRVSTPGHSPSTHVPHPQDYDRQFEVLRRVLDLGLDVYGYVTLTSPHDDCVGQGVADLMDRLQGIDPHFPLRVIPLRIQVFTPVERRLARDSARERSIAVQEGAIAAWTSELKRRFPPEVRALQICDVPLRARNA